MFSPREVRISVRTSKIITAAHEDADVQSVILSSRDDESSNDFAESVARTLTDSPPWLHCKFLYDDRGSRLFEKICAQPEYYLTRTEEAILSRHAADIARETGAVTLIELGSGSSVKTDHLLRAYGAEGESVLYVPVDVSESAIASARDAILKRHRDVTVTGIVGTYEKAYPLFGDMSPCMVIFLGSTIGNFNQQEADRFWRDISEALDPGDYFLLGVDLVKDERVLNAAYNDAAGVTAEFTKNLFARINRELGAHVDLDEIEHVAAYNGDWQRIETFLRVRSDQEVYIASLDRAIPIAAGTMVMTEISRKFTLEQIRENLPMYGLEVKRVFTDERGWFGVLLLERTERAG